MNENENAQVTPEVVAAPPKPAAVVLLSGGMDSLTAAGIARRDGFDFAAIHFNYGQRTEEAELRSFHKIAGFFDIPADRRLVVHTNFFSQIGGSALTDGSIPVPQGSSSSCAVPVTYVPFRNAVLLSMAVGYAEKLGASAVYYGAVSTDSSGYPDCRPQFVEAFQRLVAEGTKAGGGIEIRAPLIGMDKAKIVATAISLELPLGSTWSCYARNDFACGVCESCLLRLGGFKSAGAEDPLPYARASATLDEVRSRKLESIQRLSRLLRALTTVQAEQSSGTG